MLLNTIKASTGFIISESINPVYRLSMGKPRDETTYDVGATRSQSSNLTNTCKCGERMVLDIARLPSATSTSGFVEVRSKQTNVNIDVDCSHTDQYFRRLSEALKR